MLELSADAVHREHFRQERRGLTLATMHLAGVVALVGVPAWALLDHVLVAEEATAFLVVRLLVVLVVAAGWVLLNVRAPAGAGPEYVAFMMLSAVVVGIAWMLPRVGEHLEVYALGLSLPVYASGFLIAWRWQWNVAVLVVLLLAAVGFGATAPTPLTLGEAVVVIFYVGTAGAIALGAQIQRERMSWQRFVALARLEEEREHSAALVAELDRLSREDPLTGLGNRRVWEERLQAEMHRARRTGGPLSVILCDLDNFKTVNDSFGHAAGDAVLRRIGRLLAGRVRVTDVVVRLGGDEFGVLCPDTSLEDAAGLARDLADLVRDGNASEKSPVTLSVGVAESAEQEGPADLLRRTDRALYQAKATKDAVRIG